MGSVFRVRVMKAYGRVEVWYHTFSNLGTRLDDWSASRPGRFTIRERSPGTVRDLRLPPRSQWDVRSFGLLTHHWLVFIYRRFGTACQFHLQRSSSPKRSFWTVWPLNMGLMGCPETSVNTNQRCVTSQKIEDLSPAYSLNRGLGGARTASDALGKRQVSCPYRESNAAPSSVSLIAQSVHRLRYPGVFVATVCTASDQWNSEGHLTAIHHVLLWCWDVIRYCIGGRVLLLLLCKIPVDMTVFCSFV